MAELPLKYFEKFAWGEKCKISRVKYENGIQLFENGDNTGNTIYINQDNMYIVEKEQIDNIYNNIKDLEIYSFEGDSIIDPSIDVGDLLLIDNKHVLFQGTSEYKGKFKANISSKIQLKEKEETTVRTPSQKTINRRVQSQINQAEGTITTLVAETAEHEAKLSKQEQDIESIRQNVSNSVDYKRKIEGVTEVYLPNAKSMDALRLEIRGNKTYETNLKPRTDLYPENNLHIN